MSSDSGLGTQKPPPHSHQRKDTSMPFDAHLVKPGDRPILSKIDTRATPGFDGKRDENKERAEKEATKNVSRMAELQERLYAENKRALLVVLQGMDTSGKDGVVRHVFSGLNPQGCHVTSFKKPSEAEADRDFLWRIHAAVPPKGEIAVFNRAHYEDVLVVRVHNFVPEKVWKKRYEMINEFERYISENGVRVVKFMLHISKDEQAERLRARIDDPSKRWKFSPQDLEERKFWKDYQSAYEDLLTKCSTTCAPWHVIPADRKWYRDWAVSTVLREVMEEMAPEPPKIEFDTAAIVVE